jgi:hypothetical protein
MENEPMLRRIIDWFKRKRDGVDPSRVWSVSAHQTWGDNIDIQVMPEARGGQLLQVSGHLSNPKMREGDFLAVPMLSRRVGDNPRKRTNGLADNEVEPHAL